MVLAEKPFLKIFLNHKAYGSDATTGTQLAVISNILAIITLPLIIGLI